MSYERKCQNCGAENATNRDFCWKCNASFTAPGGFAGGAAVPGEPMTERSSKLRNRYRDGFRAAAIIDGFGGVVKIIGFIVGTVCLLGGSVAGKSGFMIGIFIGATVCALFFVLGVFISAQGQLLKATLDAAVHTSPFLDDEEKAAALGI